VILLDGSTRVAESNEATGRRDAPTIQGYEFSRDQGVTWYDAGSGPTFLDSAAPMGAIDAPISVTARYPLGYVRLQVTAEPTALPPAASWYQLRARTALGAGPASSVARGYRGLGEI